MAYVSAPLWCLFLALSTLLLATHTLVDPQYFVEPRQLFPIWPEWHPEKALALFSATATILFLPKILSVLLIINKGARGFGGALRVTCSMLIELLFSMLLAPVRMLFHTRFVLGAFLGWAVGWKSPPRADNETGWGQAIQRHGVHSVIGVVWGVLVYWLNPSFVWWLLPIAGALTLSVPLSVLSSRVSLGRAFRRAGFVRDSGRNRCCRANCAKPSPIWKRRRRCQGSSTRWWIPVAMPCCAPPRMNIRPRPGCRPVMLPVKPCCDGRSMPARMACRPSRN